MALFRASLRTFSRSKGDSATAAAAYRAGIDLLDDRLGMTHKFSRRRGVEAVLHFAPPGAPAWAHDTVKLWNAAERAETRSNARVARELVVSLPHELSAAQRLALAAEISRALVERYQMAVMLAVHAPDAKGDARNHHCHILMTTREVTSAGFGAKVRVLDDRVQGPLEVEFLRQMVEERTNAALERANLGERVDRRSLDERAKAAEEAGDFEGAARLTREPTGVVGRVATAAARRGVPQERMSENAVIRAEHEHDLAAFLARVRTEGRLMPSSSDRRRAKLDTSTRAPRLTTSKGVALATGKDAKLLNAQAEAGKKAQDAARDLAQAYIDGLRLDALSAQQILDAYLVLMKREMDRALWAERCAKDGELVGLLREAVHVRLELMKLGAVATQRRADAQSATAAREEVQEQEAALVEQAAPAWNLVARRRWKAAHVAHAAKLRRAIAVEQRGRADAYGPGRKELRSHAAALRARMAQSDRDICARLSAVEGKAAAPPTLLKHGQQNDEPGRTGPRLR